MNINESQEINDFYLISSVITLFLEPSSNQFFKNMRKNNFNLVFILVFLRLFFSGFLAHQKKNFKSLGCANKMNSCCLFFSQIPLYSDKKCNSYRNILDMRTLN
jgi:hypothetical protein